MNNDYVGILHATDYLRSGDPAGVTAIIQNALAAAGQPESGEFSFGTSEDFSFGIYRFAVKGIAHLVLSAHEHSGCSDC